MFKFAMVLLLGVVASGTFLFYGTGPVSFETLKLSCVNIWQSPPSMPSISFDSGADDGRFYIFEKQISFFKNYTVYAQACDQMAAKNPPQALALFNKIITADSANFQCSSLPGRVAFGNCNRAALETFDLLALSSYYMAVIELTLNSDCTAGIDHLNKSISLTANKSISEPRKEFLSKVREECFNLNWVDQLGLDLRTWVRKTIT